MIIVPCCGESTRFKGLKKQFLTHPIGIPLPIYSVTGIAGKDENVLFIFLEDEFYDRYGSITNFINHGKHVGIVAWVELLERQTVSVVDTIMAAHKQFSVREDFYIKDCDNYWEFAGNAVRPENSVATIDMYKTNSETRNKSFSRGQPIKEIRERAVISSSINVGGYGFRNASLFMEYSSGCTTVAEVIQKAIDAGEVFKQDPAKNYEDYGTLADWQKYISKFEEK